ncbi:TIGR03621 family F420-dependent LLM class oxidoreductase [Frankia sp. CNm7]|uniref:TIGR03621 family F420-dependent LLM class oxidoreductase n=1 Tax=Frankia nepalensis TaxID=1836974 RepID=A0A937UN15_9ACTN|nr:TIGR03621 family F420-dependent LLM class oxidoreductase [Frankia nepalensis]MBL7496712.1 TIGR03621 family F420-dependent LLM class oxidoreductase [Frankia nepalensis]MBL7511058.1 TIGR03621 family F420-dependent LLM class oxidoreductase [Frankia nepalensis]MBL7516720.1 TIGR03621 family F420-dependent LLM class oxidoreductase [Frankia nepalensis]MBL7627452.1 TIGR03621 family F420-dependent LLM class oxidoreductase [Frankia nepalensis]
MGVRPIRFGTGPGRVSDRATLLEAGRSIERLGYATFAMADHFMLPFAPLLALQAVADVTSTVRLTQTVLNQDFRHPAVLAKELATLDVLSGGRLEVGIGAGWMRAEYAEAGLRFDDAPVRIDRLEEVVVILKGLFAGGPFSFAGRHFTLDGLEGSPAPAQRPRPPIMIGGGGRRLLSVAGRQADIVQIMPRISGGTSSAESQPFTAETYDEKVGWIRAAAGDRFGEIELGAQLLTVTITDDPDEGFDAFFARFTRLMQSRGSAVPSKDELRSSPLVAVGPLDEVCAKLLDTRDRFGISYFSAPLGATPESLAPVIERLSGRERQ